MKYCLVTEGGVELTEKEQKDLNYLITELYCSQNCKSIVLMDSVMRSISMFVESLDKLSNVEKIRIRLLLSRFERVMFKTLKCESVHLDELYYEEK